MLHSLIRLCCLLTIILPAFGDSSRPNILWLFSDDHAVQAIGAYGGRLKPFNLTPNIDSIGAEGMVFDRAYVANSICAPSRATLLTGKMSHKNGKYTNFDFFNHDQQQFQKILQTNGYQTAMIGKIHLDGDMQGFDYWEVLHRQGVYNNPRLKSAKGYTRYEGHCTTIITDRALNWLQHERDTTKPFMAMVHFKAPHGPWHPHPKYKKLFRSRVYPEPETLFDDYAGRGAAAKSQNMTIQSRMGMELHLQADSDPERAAYLKEHNPQGNDLIRWKYQAYMQDYLACVAGVDDNIGRLLAWLKETGLDQNTVVMYSSDQGFYLGEHGWYDKRFMYEESFRTPLLVRWPGVTKAGSRNSDFVQNIDFAETFLDIAGAPIPGDMQGESLVPLLKGQTPEDWRSALYYHYYEYPGTHSVRRHEGIAEKRFKLIRFYGKDVPNDEEWEFYDLEKDPSEMHSEYENPEYAPTIERLKKELSGLREIYDVDNKVEQVIPDRFKGRIQRMR
jgi:arylsulfatase A-like enzyme